MKLALVTVLTILTQCVCAAVGISPINKTFNKNGGGAAILTTGSGSWTASTDAPWINIVSAAGEAGKSCTYTVSANMTADTRVGIITIAGNIYTVTQTGYEATLSPTSKIVDLNGGSFNVTVSVDAGVSWTATANDDWFSVSPVTGMSSANVVVSVNPYEGVTTRTGSLTIAGKTFTLSQTGTDVNIAPGFVTKSCGVSLQQVTVNALSSTSWTVTPNTTWISVIDAGNGRGDSTVTLAFAANPSYLQRTGTVTIGSATFSVRQLGVDEPVLSIMPTEATASATGAYGNIAVYATPDAGWTAESLDSWIKISNGEDGAGNGNIKYVTSANPTLVPRTGQIKITPPTYVPPIDLMAGLQWLFSGTNTYSGTTRYNYTLYRHSGTGYAYVFSFMVSGLDRINRLEGGTYVNEQNHLVIGSQPTDFVIEASKWYTVLQNAKADGSVDCYVGIRDQTLSKVMSYNKTAAENTAQQTITITVGYSEIPTVGYLTGGKISNVRGWSRSLLETECEAVDTHQSVMLESRQAGAPEDAYCAFIPCGGNLFSSFAKPSSISANITSYYSSSAGGIWKSVPGRTGLIDRAMKGAVKSYMSITRTSSFGKGACAYVLWICPEQLPTDTQHGEIVLFDSGSGYNQRSLRLKSDGALCFIDSESDDLRNGIVFPNAVLKENEWVMISVSQIASGNVAVYVNGDEVGNVSVIGKLSMASNSEGWLHIGGGGTYSSASPYYCLNGPIDEIALYNRALTSAEIKAIYEASKPRTYIHTVTQGVVEPSIDKDKIDVAQQGGTGEVTLTIAQNVNWTASKAEDWITFLSASQGTGPTTLRFEFAENVSVTPRTGTITIAGKTVTVVQQPLGVEVSYDGAVFDETGDNENGGMGIITINTEGDADWTAESDVDWIYIVSGDSGHGNGSVWFVVNPMELTLESRIGTLTVAGKAVTVTQRGYELSIDPMIAEVGGNAGAGEFGVVAPIGAVWEAIATEPWIRLIGGTSGVGNGVLQYEVDDNLSGETRTGTIVVSGTKYTITQRSTLPLRTSVVGNGTVAGAGDYNQGTSVTLTAQPAAGYVFSHWSGDVVGVTNVATVVMETAKNVTATFIPETAAEQLAEAKAAQGGFYTRDQIHALEMGNLVLDVDSAHGTARVGVRLMESSDLSDPNGWTPVGLSQGNIDIGADGTVGLNVEATGNAKFFKVVVPEDKW